MSKWKSGDDYAIVFDDKTGEERSDEELGKMVEEIRTVANTYGFDLSSHGSFKGIQKMAVSGVFSIIECDIREMMIDAVDRIDKED